MLTWIVNFQEICSFSKTKPCLQDVSISEHLLMSCREPCSTKHSINTSLPCTVGEGLLVGWRKGSLEALAVFKKEPSKSWPDGLEGAPNGSKVAPRKQEKGVSLSYGFTHSINIGQLSLLQGPSQILEKSGWCLPHELLHRPILSLKLPSRLTMKPKDFWLHVNNLWGQRRTPDLPVGWSINSINKGPVGLWAS